MSTSASRACNGFLEKPRLRLNGISLTSTIISTPWFCRRRKNSSGSLCSYPAVKKVVASAEFDFPLEILVVAILMLSLFNRLLERTHAQIDEQLKKLRNLLLALDARLPPI